ncbi:MAG: hypothetical protein HKN09_10455 [Saprospiraceae bacterium]|nr:hypothetical protein [Saprospiraceae bacterium]
MFLFEYFKFVAAMLDKPFYSNNLPTPNANEFKNSEQGILSPSRLFPKELTPGCFSIFLLRHPMDMLVSQYFSFGYMHKLESEEQRLMAKEIQEMGIDEFCIREADDLLRRYRNILDIAAYENKKQFMLVSYYDMVLNFQIWNDKVLSNFDLTDEQKDLIYEEFYHQFSDVDELSPEEIMAGKKKRHKRKMYPGDHLEKLKPETIEILNRKFSHIVQLVNQVKEQNTDRVNLLLSKARKRRKLSSSSKLKQWDGNHWQIIKSDKIQKLQFNGNDTVFAIMEQDGGKSKLYKLEDNVWTAFPGSNIRDFATGSDNDLYVIRDLTDHTGCIMRWSDDKWVRLPGKNFDQVLINNGTLYVKNQEGKVFEFNEKTWVPLKGSKLFDLKVDKANKLYAFRENQKGDKHLFIYADGEWSPIKGSLNLKDYYPVNSDLIYALGSGKKDGKLFKYNGQEWSRLPGSDIAQFRVGKDGSLWILRDTQNIKGKIFVWDQEKWMPLPGKESKAIYVKDKNSVWSV